MLATYSFRYGQSSGIQNAYFLIENCLPQASRIMFDARTLSESAVPRNVVLKSNLIKVAETSFTNHGSFQNYPHPNDHAIGPKLNIEVIEFLA